MYLLIPIIIVLFFVLFLSYYHRKKLAVQKVGRMSYAWKCDLLNELAVPFGFSYQFVQDIFTFRDDAWQKEFGYGEFYDLNALSMHMILDCEPVYFNYHGKTWLIEFCKGQYGINTGAEAGIYHADSVVPPALRPQTVFTAAAEDEVLPVKLRLTGPDCPLFSISQKQWRVSGFVMGTFTAPEDLILEAAVTFPDPDMCTAFTRAMNGSRTRIQYSSTSQGRNQLRSWHPMSFWKNTGSCRVISSVSFSCGSPILFLRPWTGCFTFTTHIPAFLRGFSVSECFRSTGGKDNELV